MFKKKSVKGPPKAFVDPENKRLDDSMYGVAKDLSDDAKDFLEKTMEPLTWMSC